MSPIRVITARHLLTRKTLLKPGLPEPTLRISMPVPSMARTAKGIDPSRKQITNRMMIPSVPATIFRLLADFPFPLSRAEFRDCVANLLPQDYQIARIVDLSNNRHAHRNRSFPAPEHLPAQ